MKVIYGKYIVTDPDILVGKPFIKGTRIPVDLILKKLAQDIPVEDLLKDYPRLNRKHIQEIMAYAHSLISKEKVYPLNS